MATQARTHNTEQIIAAPVGTPATLMGWVQHRRDLGQLVFIALRDRWGELQCVFDPEHSPAAHTVAETLRSEYVVALSGVTRPRPEKELRAYPGGDREFIVDAASVLNAAETPPFMVEDEVKASEEMRLKYRYIDLRRRPMVRALTMRHTAINAIRTYLNGQGFLEIETPLLARSTPEGARDYVVPSRVHHGSFYALPQSPQLFKQILMCGGIDRYYQIAKCLRDEDLRGNRQPEHTQLDLEMSFASRDELFAISEGAMSSVWRACLDVALPTPFRRMNYDEAIRRYGSDKPDLRFASEICDLTEHFADTTAEFVRSGLAEGQRVHGVFIPGASLSRKQLDEWTATAKSAGASGLMTLELGAEVKGTMAKFIVGAAHGRPAGGPWPAPTGNGSMAVSGRDSVGEPLGAPMGGTSASPTTPGSAGMPPPAESKSGQGRPPSPEPGTWFMIMGPERKNLAALGQLRLKLGQAFNLIDTTRWEWLWVVDFPLYERDAETGEVTPAHHAFTSPLAEDLPKLQSDDEEVLLSIRADNYDLVLNGVEMSSGSLRIFDPAVQMQVLRKVGLSDAQIEERFGWFLAAYRYGAPPHRGFGQGLDRLLMSLLSLDNIRDVIAFPKTATASCPLTGAPASIDEAQWRELGIKPR